MKAEMPFVMLETIQWIIERKLQIQNDRAFATIQQIMTGKTRAFISGFAMNNDHIRAQICQHHTRKRRWPKAFKLDHF